jgi:hypothetical protein
MLEPISKPAGTVPFSELVLKSVPGNALSLGVPLWGVNAVG